MPFIFSAYSLAGVEGRAVDSIIGTKVVLLDMAKIGTEKRQREPFIAARRWSCT
jgi:hypothetical protein